MLVSLFRPSPIINTDSRGLVGFWARVVSMLTITVKPVVEGPFGRLRGSILERLFLL